MHKNLNNDALPSNNCAIISPVAYIAKPRNISNKRILSLLSIRFIAVILFFTWNWQICPHLVYNIEIARMPKRHAIYSNVRKGNLFVSKNLRLSDFREQFFCLCSRFVRWRSFECTLHVIVCRCGITKFYKNLRIKQLELRH